MNSLSLLIRSSIIVSLMSVGFSAPSYADPLERGLQGALGGAIIGGIVGGGKGAGRGAAIGGVIGIIGGAMEEEDRRRYRQRRYRRSYGRSYRRTSSVSSSLVIGIQGSLVRLGYNPGPVDGVFGGQTARAIGNYQDEYGLRVTRRPSRALLRHMKNNGG